MDTIATAPPDLDPRRSLIDPHFLSMLTHLAEDAQMSRSEYLIALVTERFEDLVDRRREGRANA